MQFWSSLEISQAHYNLDTATIPSRYMHTVNKEIYREKQLDFKFTFAHALRTITYTAKKKPLKTNTLNSQYLGGPKTQ